MIRSAVCNCGCLNVFTRRTSYQDVKPMSMYVCWEIDMLFCVKLCQDIIKRGSCCRWCMQVKIKVANNIKCCVHGCNIFQKVLEFFKEVSWVTWKAIHSNEKPTEARIIYVKTDRFKGGVVRAGVQVYVE